MEEAQGTKRLHTWNLLIHQKGAPGRLSRLGDRLLVLAQVMISQFCEFEPHVGLCAGSVGPAWDSLFLSLCPYPTHTVFVSLKVNKLLKIKKITD